jgi:hypothetical protein
LANLPLSGNTNNRFEEVIFSTLGMIKTNGLIHALFYADASGGFRLIINTLYLLSVFIYPFGRGYGGLSYRWLSIAETFGINVFKNGHFRDSIDPSEALDAQAYIPNLIGTVGIFSILFIVFLYSHNKQRDRWLKYSILIVLTLFLWFLQSNFFNPVFWVLIGIVKLEDPEKKEVTKNTDGVIESVF